HISEVRKLVGGKRIDAVEDVLSIGQKVQVELKEIDPRGKLSLAAVLPEGAEAPAEGADGEGAGSDAQTDTPAGDNAGDNGGAERPRERREGGRSRSRRRTHHGEESRRDEE
ncbi:MAG: polyribonucleotide nucleotidyltransferase, partial [Tetrasphaera sp.]|nr:polyribonucleotide nucleotidyltransferase [Tetrasphaera sp.]